MLFFAPDFALVFLAAGFFIALFVAGFGPFEAAGRPPRRGFFDGPAARRALMSAIASSSVTASADIVRGSVAFTSPSVT